MKLKKNHKFILSLNLLLTFVSVALIISFAGFYSNKIWARPGANQQDLTNQDSAQQSQQPNINQFVQNFQKWSQERNRIFDQFFDDDFFMSHDDIFKEMMDFQNRVMNQMNTQMQKKSFQKGYNDWFEDKYGFGTDEFYQEEKDGKVYFHIKIPGMDTSDVNIEVNDRSVSIKGTFEQKTQNEDANGNTMQSYSSQSFQKVVPLPYEVDQSQIEFQKGKDEVVLVFPAPGQEIQKQKINNTEQLKKGKIETL